MTRNNRFFDDLGKLASSATSTFAEWRNEVENLVNTQVEKFLKRSNLVSREDFDVVRDIALKARAEQEKLAKRVTELEKQLSGKTPAKTGPTPKAAAKPASKATSKVKARPAPKVG